MSKQRHKHADLIIAWANGAEIEFIQKIDSTKITVEE